MSNTEAVVGSLSDQAWGSANLRWRLSS